MKLFTPIPFLVQIWTNRIKVTRLDTGKAIMRESSNGFSNTRVVFADFMEAEQLLRAILNELAPTKPFIRKSYAIAMQQMERTDGGLCSIEKRALIDSAEHAGAKCVVLIEDEREHARQSVLEKLKQTY